jgi:hypothetical protein
MISFTLTVITIMASGPWPYPATLYPSYEACLRGAYTDARTLAPVLEIECAPMSPPYGYWQ